MSAQRTPVTVSDVRPGTTAARRSMTMAMTVLLHERGELHAVDASRTSLATPEGLDAPVQTRDRRRPLGGRHDLSNSLR
jgi:hypothetical protein